MIASDDDILSVCLFRFIFGIFVIGYCIFHGRRVQYGGE